MKKPTIPDLARAAGVSPATVNRLLHRSATVRPDTAERIVETARRIGFYGLGALDSRKRAGLPRHSFGFLLQQSHRAIYRLWAEAIAEAAQRRGDAVITTDVRFEDDLSAEAVAGHLIEMGRGADALAVVTADHPLVGQAVDTLRGQGVPVFAWVTDLSAPARAGFVGTDNWKLGRTAAWLISHTAPRPGRIVSLVGSHRYQCQDVSDASFRSFLREHAPAFEVGETRVTGEEPDAAFAIASALLDDAALSGLFVIGGGISGVLRAMRALPPERRGAVRLVCRDIGPEARKGLGENLITAALRHPPERMADALIDSMLRAVQRPSFESVMQCVVPFEILTPENV